MSYIVNKTDGSILTEIVDGTIDQTATDLTLIGKNSSNYGEFLNENLVKLLENFANTSQPNNPVQGQLWFDTSEGRLKVYDGNGFKVSGGTIVSNTVPTLTQGDIWINSATQQMFFNDGSAPGGVLAGPIYTSSQGVTGFQVADIIDTNQISHTVVYLYVAQVLIGIFSKSAFTPANEISGFSGPIEIGFNVSSYGGVKFNVPVTQADALLAADDTLKTAESFLSTTGDSATNGTISIQNTTPLILGPGGLSGSSEIKLSNLSFQINSNTINQNFVVNSLNGNGLLPSIYVDAANQFVGIYTNTPTATLDVNGDAVIQGSLTVNGNLTSINATNIEVEDKLIEIGKSASASNATADGGGISLDAGSDGDKTFTWDLIKESWNSSENINVPAGKSYKVNGFGVLNQTTLGTTVVNSSLTSVGVLTTLQAANLAINAPGASTNTLSFVGVQADGDVVLLPKGIGAVKVSNKKISEVADPTNATDAVNLQTLAATVRSAPLAFSADTTGLTDIQIATNILAIIFPTSEHENTTICRVHCIDGAVRINKQFRILSGTWTFESNITA